MKYLLTQNVLDLSAMLIKINQNCQPWLIQTALLGELQRRWSVPVYGAERGVVSRGPPVPERAEDTRAVRLRRTAQRVDTDPELA